jgi:hypothetical protein
LKNLAEIFHLLIGSRLLQTLITLIDSSLLARFQTNGFQTPLELPHVPRGFRKAYIPGWNQDCENLYQEYNTNHDRATANRLLEELNDQRKRKWEKERISFILAEKRGVCFGNLVPW